MARKAYIRIAANAVIVMLSMIYMLFLIKVLYLDRVAHIYFGEGYRYNLIPLRTIRMYVLNYQHYNRNTLVTNLIGNVVVFVPLGCIYAYFFKSLKRFVPFIISFIATIVGIESLQMVLQLGSFDVDDILLNSIGGIIGFWFLLFVNEAGRRVERNLYAGKY